MSAASHDTPAAAPTGITALDGQFGIHIRAATAIADLLAVADGAPTPLSDGTLSGAADGLFTALDGAKLAFERLVAYTRQVREPAFAKAPAEIAAALEAAGWTRTFGIWPEDGETWTHMDLPGVLNWQGAVADAIASAGSVPDVELLPDISMRAVAGKAGDEGVQP